MEQRFRERLRRVDEERIRSRPGVGPLAPIARRQASDPLYNNIPRIFLRPEKQPDQLDLVAVALRPRTRVDQAIRDPVTASDHRRPLYNLCRIGLVRL